MSEGPCNSNDTFSNFLNPPEPVGIELLDLLLSSSALVGGLALP